MITDLPSPETIRRFCVRIAAPLPAAKLRKRNHRRKPRAAYLVHPDLAASDNYSRDYQRKRMQNPAIKARQRASQAAWRERNRAAIRARSRARAAAKRAGGAA